jgi:two-component system sensor histidine kinase/response regulator
MTIRFPLEQISGFNFADGLERCVNDPDFYWRLLLDFRDRFGGVSESAESLMLGNRWQEAEELIHTLKGTAGQLGLEDVEAAASGLNDDLTGTLAAGLAPTTLTSSLNNVRQALARMTQVIQSIADRTETQ